MSPPTTPKTPRTLASKAAEAPAGDDTPEAAPRKRAPRTKKDD